MRLLLTSDSQAELGNLDLLQVSIDELLAAAHEYKPDAIIHAGDLKEKYDPVNMAVIKFWVRQTRRIVDEGFRFIILRGNHDRISQSVDSKDWLDVLRAAGAETVSKPKVKQVGDGRIAFLPYTPDKAQERQWAKQLAKDIQPDAPIAPLVLVFHTEIAGAIMNASGTLAVGNTGAQLKFSTYHACFGGHLHEHQAAGPNGWYIGSPFTHDWGEANQQKGIILADVDVRRAAVQQLKTSIPGWYDAEWLHRNKVKPEPGAYIRSKVSVTTKKITQQIKDEEERLQAAYGSEIKLFVIPRVEASKTEEMALAGSTDQENVEKYVAATLNEGSGFVASRVVAYLVGKLAAGGASRLGNRIRFLSFEGHNVLSFRELKFRYSGQGLVLVKGENRDWPKRSNGSGKTNLLGMLPVALFGETLKGQKNDAWANERTKERAVACLTWKDAGGRSYNLSRTRKPHGLRLEVEGKDASTGLTGKRRGETQGQIEEITGFDFHLLKNAVYIDQTIANGFVFGTQKGRLDLMNKILNLQRFEDAGKLVAADAKEAATNKSDTEHELEKLEDDLAGYREDLKELEGTVKSDWAKELKSAKATLQTLREAKASLTGYEKPRIDELIAEVDDAAADLKSLAVRLDELRSKVAGVRAIVRRMGKLVDRGRCGECGRRVSQVQKGRLDAKEAELRNLEEEIEALEREFGAITARQKKKQARIDEWEADVREADRQITTTLAIKAQAEKAAKEESQRNQKYEEKITNLRRQVKRTKKKIESKRDLLKSIDIDIEMYEYAKKSLHRTGMPLWISSTMLPVLNKAASDYSEIFTDGKMNLVFDIEDGEFTAKVINPAGSEKEEGQSTGEAAMAGVISAFSLREIAPRTNLLILDEPGHGLDAHGAKQFARGLLRLRELWPKTTMLVTTHSSIIQGILEGEAKTWTVIKEKGISRLMTE